MFDFARRVQEAVGDTVRRTAMKAVAGMVGLMASGFLTAALWSWLANDLDWGSTLASLTIGGGLILLMIILLAMFIVFARHLDALTLDVVDLADVNAVRADNFHVFLDLAHIDHLGLLFQVTALQRAIVGSDPSDYGSS